MSIAHLQEELALKKSEYAELQERFDLLREETNVDASPVQVSSQHIRKLKEYNELRDTGLRLVQLIANERNATTKTIFDEMGIDMKDE